MLVRVSESSQPPSIAAMPLSPRGLYREKPAWCGLQLGQLWKAWCTELMSDRVLASVSDCTINSSHLFSFPGSALSTHAPISIFFHLGSGTDELARFSMAF
jgi:hypothetical protein